MKTIFKITTIIVLFTSLLSSCTDWLDVKPEGSPNEANFWNTDQDYEKAAVSLYNCLSLEGTWGRNLFWEQGASDDIFFSRSRGNSQMNLANLDMNGSTEGSIKDIYNIMYETMSEANNIIYHVFQLDATTPIIDRTLGEAYFMRAFSHFMIAYRYGRIDNGVPFDAYEDSNDLLVKIPEQRASVVDNYRLIIEDLDNAIAVLPWFSEYGTDDYGRATKDAAIALKVKTYAYWAQHDASQWENIPALVDLLETGGNRGLLDNFADVFKIENEWIKEYIWSVNSSGTTYAGSVFPGIMLDNKGWGRYNGWGNFKPTLELFAEYDAADARRAATILKYGDTFTFFGEQRKFYSTADLECGFHFNKYMDPFKYGSVDPVSGAGVSDKVSPNGDRPTTDLNVPIIRFAEMLLFKAEALIETNQGAKAAQTLNRLTTRAGLGNLYTTATIEDLMHERRCELAGEYTDRLMDLKRWAAKYPAVTSKIESAKHGLKYENRSDPASALVPNGTDTGTGQQVMQMVINGKTFNGVIEIMSAKDYDPAKDCVLPYEQNEVIKARGALKQNPGY